MGIKKTSNHIENKSCRHQGYKMVPQQTIKDFLLPKKQSNRSKT